MDIPHRCGRPPVEARYIRPDTSCTVPAFFFLLHLVWFWIYSKNSAYWKKILDSQSVVFLDDNYLGSQLSWVAWSIVFWKSASGRWKTRTAPLFSHIYADFPHFRVFGRKQSCSACVWTLFDGKSPLIRQVLTYQPGLSRCEGKRHVISILGRPGNYGQLTRCSGIWRSAFLQ